MFKKDYSWIDDYIEAANDRGRALVAAAFETLKGELEEADATIRSLRIELSRYKPRKRAK